MYRKVIIGFLIKYFFILKAAAEGWRVTYDGGNTFEFVHNLRNAYGKENFINRYTNIILLKEKY
jgi:uncharacterized protein YutD